MRVVHHVREAVPQSPAEESLYERTGRLLGLSVPIHSELELMQRLQKGLSAHSIRSLRTRVGLKDEELYRLIAPRRTLNRRETQGQDLSAEEADRAVRVARVAARAQQVFNRKPDYAQEWLRTAQRALGDRSPMEVLGTESGARAVEEILLGLEHGIFS
ncbi:MAG TPA: antitoxin Xre/MbcA/ParS toxin-binding domain-containing protein [Steroidobacteraceae bacterium]|nr:antitoxin Xre/MbcA/ParS toxin-binding domain-containing protein [Steroidobacteraceae bacterium]